MSTTRDKKIYTYEFIHRHEEREIVMHLQGTRIDWEPMNETFILFKLWNENDEVFYWCLTDKSASCKVLSSSNYKKATRSGNVVSIEQGDISG